MSLININTILVNEWGEPVQGAHASIIRETSLLRVSDVNGRITLNNVLTSEILVITYVGVQTTIPVSQITNTTIINTILEGEEVVIKGDKTTSSLFSKVLVGGFLTALLYAAVSYDEPKKHTF